MLLDEFWFGFWEHLNYDFFVITGLRLGGKRILVNDSFT